MGSFRFFKIRSLTEDLMERCWGILASGSTSNIHATTVYKGKRHADAQDRSIIGQHCPDEVWDVFLHPWDPSWNGAKRTVNQIVQWLKTIGLDFADGRVSGEKKELLRLRGYHPWRVVDTGAKNRDLIKKQWRTQQAIASRAFPAPAAASAVVVVSEDESLPEQQQLQDQSAEAQEKIRQLEDQLQAKTTRIGELEQQIKDLQSEIDLHSERAEEKIQEQKEHIQELEEQIQGLTETNRELQEQTEGIEDQESTIETLRQQLQDQSAEAQEKTTRIGELEQQLQEQSAEAPKELRQLEAQINDLKSKIEHYSDWAETKIKAQAEQIEDLKFTIETRVVGVANLQQQVRDIEARLEEQTTTHGKGEEDLNRGGKKRKAEEQSASARLFWPFYFWDGRRGNHLSSNTVDDLPDNFDDLPEAS
jgi:predicted  nucleic acid-binding Zn-ribbon protein